MLGASDLSYDRIESQTLKVLVSFEDGRSQLVYLHPMSELRGQEVVEILERARDTFVGTVEISRNFAFLLPDSRKMPFDIFIPQDKLKGVEHGQKAIARILDWPVKMKNPFGEIVDILGQ